MLENKTIVYGTHSVDKAYALCTQLLDAGINARVLEDSQGNLGFEMGWHGHTAAVVVPYDDAEAGREIAREFDEDGVHNETWPRCPECDEPRQTFCPICETAGTDFQKAYHDLVETDESTTVTTLLMCPMCDEPFAPQYPCYCVGCGHEFEDGIDIDPIQYESPEQANNRVTFVIIGLAVVSIGLLTYLAYVVR